MANIRPQIGGDVRPGLSVVIAPLDGKGSGIAGCIPTDQFRLSANKALPAHGIGHFNLIGMQLIDQPIGLRSLGNSGPMNADRIIPRCRIQDANLLYIVKGIDTRSGRCIQGRNGGRWVEHQRQSRGPNRCQNAEIQVIDEGLGSVRDACPVRPIEHHPQLPGKGWNIQDQALAISLVEGAGLVSIVL